VYARSYFPRDMERTLDRLEQREEAESNVAMRITRSDNCAQRRFELHRRDDYRGGGLRKYSFASIA